MNLFKKLPKNLPFVNRSEHQEYYFGLNISSHQVVGSVWGIEGKELQIIKVSTATFEDQSDLINAANQALDDALADFQPEPNKILFGVPDNWLQEDSLIDEQLEFLKKMVSELDVEPMAYVSTTHAISHFLQKQTGVPPTAVLVEVADPLIVTVIKAGKLLGTKYVRQTENVAADVEKALMQFSNVEVMPAKISIFGAGNLEHLRNGLQSYNWMENLPFLHLPKIEILEDLIEIKAISLAGASEINPEVEYHSQAISTSREESISHPLPEVDRPKPQVPTVGAGFVAGDIAEMPEEEIEEAYQEADDRQEMVEEPYMEPVPRSGRQLARSSQDARPGLISRQNPKLTGRLAFLGAILSKLHLPNLGKRSLFNLKLIIPLVVVLLLIGGYIFLPKAKVTIYIDPKVLEKDAQVTADPNATSVDEASKTIPGQIIETDVTGKDSAPATGKKQVGNPAKGQVVVYNKTDSPKTFAAGTVLTGQGNIKFTLDQSVNVASQSATTDSSFNTVITPGKSDPVGVTAQAIGPDSNLPSSTLLTIQSESNSSYFAQVSSDLSGGTSKDVTVVTSDDQKILLAKLSSSLRSQAQQDLQSKLKADQKILPEALDEKITSTNYSAKVGDQATTFTLSLTIHYKGTAYSEGDLKQMVSQLIQTTVPDGYQMNLADTETQADVSKLESDGRLIFLARFTANLIPKLNTDQIKNQIKGKTPGEAADLIKQNNSVIGSDFNITPSLPSSFEHLPLLSSHISITVTTK